MKAMILTAPRRPLVLQEVPRPEPQAKEVLIRIITCGICRTDLHIVDGELANALLPLIPGHQIVGEIVSLGKDASRWRIGDKVGVAWLAKSCGKCPYCLVERENLCDFPLFTGYTRQGGYAEYCTADERFIFPLPAAYNAQNVAPLLCAGLIGYRALKLAGDTERIGFYGFGSSAHILIQVAKALRKEVYAFTRKGDEKGQEFAKKLGAAFASDSETLPPSALDAAILFAPVGSLYPTALKAVRKGGTVVSAGIHMSDIPSFPYSLLWEERVMRSVANLTRQDAEEFLAIAGKTPIHTTVTCYPLEKANSALQDLREGKIKGSAVLVIDEPRIDDE